MDCNGHLLHGGALPGGPEFETVLKTMWNMPAELLRTGASDDDAAPSDERLATGSLEQMIAAFAALDEEEAEAALIKCAGRDRPITAQEIRDLRRDRIPASTS